MNLGIAEAWSLGLPDGERHLQEGAVLAHQIGRPYLEVSCLAQLGFASKFRSFATVRQRCQEAIALAERHGWGAEQMIAPALVTLASTMTWTGEFDEGERVLRRAEQALRSDAGPGPRLLLHVVTGMLHASRGRHAEAFEEFSAAEDLQSRLAGTHALASMVAGWLRATQARLGMPGAARDSLAALPDEQTGAGEVCNARAAIQPRKAIRPELSTRCKRFSTARHRSSVTSRSSRLICWPHAPTASWVTSARRTGPSKPHSPSPSRTGWSCRSR